MKLVSFLGTSRYEPACYDWGGKQSVTPFVQRALVDLLPGISEVIVFATDKAWQANGEALMAALSGGCQRERLVDDDDFTPIFDRLNALLQPGDRLSIDITHSYRSIPVAALPLVNYLELVKDIPVSGIYYGRVTLQEEKPLPGRIVDLSSILYVERWTLAVAAFLRYGKGDQLVQILDEEVERQFKERAGSRPHTMGQLRSRLERLGQQLNTNRLVGVSREAEKLHELLASADLQREASGSLQLLLPLIDRLADDAAIFSETGSSPRSQLRLARWHLDHHDPVSAALVAREAVVTQLMEANDAGDLLMNTEAREKMGARVGQELTKAHPVYTVFGELREIRNSLAHCGMRGSKEEQRLIDTDIDPRKIPERLQSLIDQLESMLDQSLWRFDKQIPTPSDD
jgi:hypothetical protein